MATSGRGRGRGRGRGGSREIGNTETEVFDKSGRRTTTWVNREHRQYAADAIEAAQEAAGAKKDTGITERGLTQEKPNTTSRIKLRDMQKQFRRLQDGTTGEDLYDDLANATSTPSAHAVYMQLLHNKEQRSAITLENMKTLIASVDRPIPPCRKRANLNPRDGHCVIATFGIDFPAGLLKTTELGDNEARAFSIHANTSALYMQALLHRPDWWRGREHTGLRAFIHNIELKYSYVNMPYTVQVYPYSKKKKQVPWDILATPNHADEERKKLTVMQSFGLDAHCDKSFLASAYARHFPGYELPMYLSRVVTYQDPVQPQSAASPSTTTPRASTGESKKEKSAASPTASGSGTEEGGQATPAQLVMEARTAAVAAAVAAAAAAESPQAAAPAPSKSQQPRTRSRSFRKDNNYSPYVSSGVLFADKTTYTSENTTELYLGRVPTKGTTHIQRGPYADGIFLPMGYTQFADKTVVYKNNFFAQLLGAVDNDQTGGSKRAAAAQQDGQQKKDDKDAKKDEVIKTHERWVMADEFDMALVVVQTTVTFWMSGGNKSKIDVKHGISSKSQADPPTPSMVFNTDNYQRIPIIMSDNGKQFAGPYDALLLHCFRHEVNRLATSKTDGDKAISERMIAAFNSKDNFGLKSNGEVVYFFVPMYPTLSRAIQSLRRVIPYDSIANLDNLWLKVIPNLRFNDQRIQQNKVDMFVEMHMQLTYIHPMVSWLSGSHQLTQEEKKRRESERETALHA